MSQIHILSLIERNQNERPQMQKQVERSFSLFFYSILPKIFCIKTFY